MNTKDFMYIPPEAFQHLKGMPEYSDLEKGLYVARQVLHHTDENRDVIKRSSEENYPDHYYKENLPFRGDWQEAKKIAAGLNAKMLTPAEYFSIVDFLKRNGRKEDLESMLSGNEWFDALARYTPKKLSPLKKIAISAARTEYAVEYILNYFSLFLRIPLSMLASRLNKDKDENAKPNIVERTILGSGFGKYLMGREQKMSNYCVEKTLLTHGSTEDIKESHMFDEGIDPRTETAQAILYLNDSNLDYPGAKETKVAAMIFYPTHPSSFFSTDDVDMKTGLPVKFNKEGEFGYYSSQSSPVGLFFFQKDKNAVIVHIGKNEEGSSMSKKFKLPHLTEENRIKGLRLAYPGNADIMKK